MCLGHEIWFFFYSHFTPLVSSFFLQSLKTDCYRERNVSRQRFGRKLKIWRLNPLFTLSFFYTFFCAFVMHSYCSDFKVFYSIFYCIILLWGFRALIWVRSSCYFFLTVKKFSKLVGYWQILSIKRITICLHRWVILKFFGKKWKLASGCPRSTMNLSFDVVVFSSWRSSISES